MQGLRMLRALLAATIYDRANRDGRVRLSSKHVRPLRRLVDNRIDSVEHEI